MAFPGFAALGRARALLAPMLLTPLAFGALAGSVGAFTPAPACAAEAYPAAVGTTRKAALAVLEGAGRESCLRGKLTKALLSLSASCDASGQRNALCSLANKAVVVTPMSLTFMEDTSRELLELSKGS